MQIERRQNHAGTDPWDNLTLTMVALDTGEVEMPDCWNAAGAETLTGFLGRGSVPARLHSLPEDGVPEFLWRSAPARGAAMADEVGAQDAIDRMAGVWTYRGWKAGHFATAEDARAFLDELRAMMARRTAAPDARQWRQAGLDWAYGAAAPDAADSPAGARVWLNLLAFWEAGRFDMAGFTHAARVWALAVGIAAGSGQAVLGHVNLAALLMAMGVPYDSDRARRICADLTAAMTEAARRARPAVATAIVPADEIARLMGWDSDGIAPVPAVTVSGPDATGRHRRRILRTVPLGLAVLGYSADAIARLTGHAAGQGTLADSPAIDHADLAARGFGPAQIARVEDALSDLTDIRFVFNQWVLGQGFCRDTLGVPAALLDDPGFDLLSYLGFDAAQIAAAGRHSGGAMMLDGAPDLRPADLSVFACADRITPEARIRMAAAAEAHLSDGVADTVTLPCDAARPAIRSLFALARDLGLKSCRLRRCEGAATDRPAAVPPEPRQSGAIPMPAHGPM